MLDEDAAHRGLYSLEMEKQTCTALGGQGGQVALKAKMRISRNTAASRGPCSALSWLWSCTQGLRVCSPLSL